jgi:glucokinase
MSFVIGIDIGKTAIKMGRFSQDGTCLESMSFVPPQPIFPEFLLPKLVEAINQLDPLHQSVAIGIGTPGYVDTEGRCVKNAINLEGWQNIPLADWLEKSTNCLTTLANDANCAALGEAWLGAGQQFHNLILLTLGTGVGGAIIINDQLFIGHQGMAGELGLITLKSDGFECKSGNRGSLEQYISAQAIRRRTGLEPKQLGDMARSGDSKALEFWRNYGQELGIGLTSLIYVLTPEAILIGGGICASAEFFLPSAIAEIELRVLPEIRQVALIPAKLGNNAGMTGAAKLAWQHAIRMT